MSVPARLLYLAALVLLAVVIHGFWTVYSHYGLFRKLGADYALYHAQAVTLQTLGAEAMYDSAALHRTLESLLRESNPQAVAGFSSVPYPALFSWLLRPLTYLTLSQGFAVWSVLNLLAALHLGRRCATQFGISHRPLVVLLVLLSYPVTLTLFLGQIQIWLACAIGEAYVALRATRDFKAGCWLGFFILKPHYGVLLVPVLFWKQKWQVLQGMAVCAFAIWIASLLVAGIESVLAYPHAVRSMLGFHSDWPQAMVNWRGLLLTVRPNTGERAGFAATLLLGLVTSLAALLVWRNGWHEDRSDFPAKLTLLLIATLLTVHQSHAYGAAILAVPIIALWTSPYATPLLRAILLIGAFLPTILLTADVPVSLVQTGLFARLRPATVVTTLTLIISYLILLTSLLRRPAV